jgi:hypothetical protein
VRKWVLLLGVSVALLGLACQQAPEKSASTTDSLEEGERLDSGLRRPRERGSDVRGASRARRGTGMPFGVGRP